MHFSVFNSSDRTHKVHGKDSVDAWYDEINDHVFGVEPKSTGTGHFTQLVWKDSKYLGLGVSKNSEGEVYVVCNYDPPGNWVGKFAKSVPRVGGGF
jgi:glioma pathogenesis-related protein 2